MVPLVIDILGRRPIFVLTQLVPGVCCIVAAFLSPGSVVFTVLTLGAKALVTAAFTISYLYTAQLFPTSVRATALGACSTMARVGGALAPFLGKYLPELVSLCVFGGVGVLGGLVALLLPDTVGFPSPTPSRMWRMSRRTRNNSGLVTEVQTLLLKELSLS